MKPEPVAKGRALVKGGGNKYGQHVDISGEYGPVGINAGVSNSRGGTSLDYIKARLALNDKFGVEGSYGTGNYGTPVYGVGLNYRY